MKEKALQKLQEEEKHYPPSDQRINRFNFGVSIASVAVLATYFMLCVMLEVFEVRIPYFIFTLVVVPVEIVLLAAGIYMSIFQLVRHRYPRVKISIMLQLVTFVIAVVYIAVVVARHGWAALLG